MDRLVDLEADIIEYLENKICDGEYSEEEYNLYTEYKKIGIKAFNSREHRSVLNVIIREVCWYYCESILE